MEHVPKDEILKSVLFGVENSFDHISQYDLYSAVKEGVKEAILTMTETSDGIGCCANPTIREPFLKAIEDGTTAAVLEMNNE